MQQSGKPQVVKLPPATAGGLNPQASPFAAKQAQSMHEPSPPPFRPGGFAQPPHPTAAADGGHSSAAASAAAQEAARAKAEAEAKLALAAQQEERVRRHEEDLRRQIEAQQRALQQHAIESHRQQQM